MKNRFNQELNIMENINDVKKIARKFLRKPKVVQVPQQKEAL